MYRLRILVNDRPIPIYSDRSGQLWVEAREGTPFKVKVENNTYNRVLAVISVDGLNTINAKHEDPMNSPGYVLDSYRNISLPGWKVSQNEVRDFIFTTRDNSYASKIGESQNNVGIIGVAIISEVPIWAYSTSSFTYNNFRNTDPYYGYGSGTPGEILCMSDSSGQTNVSYTQYPSVSTDATRKEMAVGSGIKEEFKTHDVYFNRNKIETILTIRYDSRDNLIAKGIIVEGPAPFPVNSPYCPDV